MFVRRCAPRASHGAMAAGLLVWKTSLALPAGRAVGAGWYGCAFGSRIATPGFCLARFDARRAWGPAVCRCDGVAVRGGLRTG